MRIFKNKLHQPLILVSSFFLSSCSLLDFVGLGAKQKNHYNNTNLLNLKAEDIVCENTKVQSQENALIYDSFICGFDAFDIEVYNIEEMSTKENLMRIYSWFVNNVFYGSEVYTLNKIVFDGFTQDGDLFGSYSPYYKTITLFPNNRRVTQRRVVKRSIAEAFGKDEITPYDLEYWQYTLSHEYGHHQNFIYGSTNKIVLLENKNALSDHELYDFELNNVGRNFMNDFFNFNSFEEAKNVYSAEAIVAYSAKIGKCKNNKTKENNWPERTISKSFNSYRWTAAESMTRAFQLLTYHSPKELHKDDSVTAFGEIINDYAWFNHYGINLYENHYNKECEIQQNDLNKRLDQFKVLMQEKWFNEKDQEISAASYNGRKQMYLFSKHKNAKIELEKNGIRYPFEEKQRFVNTFYNWRPFDSRKQTKFQVESIPYYYHKKLPSGTYDVLMNGRKVTKAFGLGEKQSKIITSSSNRKNAFDQFYISDGTLKVRVSQK